MMKRFCLAALALTTFWGCSSSNTTSGGGPSGPNPLGPTGSFRVSFDQVQLPEGVDSAHAIFRDLNGNPVGDVVEVPLGVQSFVFPNVPLSAVLVEVDYLRNGGFALFESYHLLSSEFVEGRVDESLLSRADQPRLFAAKDARSRWSAFINPAEVRVATVGNPGQDQEEVGPTRFPIRGVGYSPAPIGSSNKDGPNFGDLFWDGFFIQGAGDLLDWSKVWKRDIEDIRNRFNSVRVYSMVAEHANNNGQFEVPPIVRTHNKFLDECWNNGHRPIYVMVGIPLPSDCLIQGGNADNRANWERLLTSSVAQMKDHPAVMGFTFFNELGGIDEWGGNPTASNFYWGQVQKYSTEIKAAAPDKLVGFSYFDAPSNVSSAQSNGLLETFGSKLDFWGVNSFQGTTVTNSLAPYKALGGATKPVIMTEFAVPATSHSVDESCDGDFPSQAGVNSIFADSTTVAKAATAMRNVLPVLLSDNVVAGAFYFEWNDEWWKQDPKPGCYDTNKERQEGGVKAALSQMPNGFNDEEGFGLHSISLNGRAAGSLFSPFDKNAATANNRPDILTPRTELLEAVTEAFKPVR